MTPGKGVLSIGPIVNGVCSPSDRCIMANIPIEAKGQGWSPITRESRSLAEADQLCPVCGKLITHASWAVIPWPYWSAANRDPTTNFRPHELVFKPRSSA